MSDNNDFTHEIVIYSSDNNNGTMGTGKFLLYDDNINALKVESIDNIKIGGGANGRVLATDGAGNLRWISAGSGGGVSSYNDLTDKPTNQSLNTGDSVSFNRLTVTGASGIEGGEIQLAKAPTSTLAGDVIIDVYENKLRFFEGGGNGRGFYLDLTTGANNTSTNIMSGGNSFSGSYNDLTDKPALFSGAYADLTGKPAAQILQAPQWNTLHNLGTGNRYLVGDLVFNAGTIYQAIADNESQFTAVGDATYWRNLGIGIRLQTDYLDLANKPSIPTDVSDLTDTTSLLSGGSNHEAYEITNTDPEGPTYSVSVGTDGVVTMVTSRGNLEFGALPEPGGPTHFHIMKPAGDNGTDLYFGDDYNYVLLRPDAYGVAPAYGVEIGANDNRGGASAGQQVWRFGTDGGLVFPDATVQTTAYIGSGSANTGDITFSGGALRNSNDNTVRLESLDINQTASYNFTPQGGDYSTAVWNGTSITFNDPTSSVQQAIWALNNFSTIEIQINGQWQTVTSGGAYTPSLPQAQRLDLNQTAVGGPLNIDEVQIVINEGTSSYAEIDGTDFTVDVQDDIRMYANDRFVLSNRGVGESIEIQTNDEDHTWSFKADGNLQLPSGGDIIDSSGASVLGGGTTLPTNASGYLVNDGYGNLSWAAGDGTFSGNYNDLTNKPTYRIAVTGSTGGPFGTNLQADSLALAGINPTENIPSTYGGDLILQGGVGGANNDLYGEVRIKSGQIGANYEWHFTTDKKIKLPAGGDIVNSTGTSVLGGSGSYTPANASNWASPAPTTIAEALDRMAAKLAYLDNQGYTSGKP